MDWLPEDDIVHLIVDAVDVMDLSGFDATYKVGHARRRRLRRRWATMQCVASR
jgi:hypothetical protein